MDESERGKLFVEKEKAEKHVEQLEKELTRHGECLSMLGQQLKSNPARIIFANAPGNLGSFGLELTNAPSFSWQDVDVIEKVAQKIQDFRAAEKRLSDINSRLRSN